MRVTLPVLAALVVLAVLASGAGATTRIEGGDPALTALYASWIAGSAVPTANTVVQLEDRECTELRVMTCTDTGRRPMRMAFPDMRYLFDGSDTYAQSRLVVRATFLHELGHVRDFTPRKTHRYRALFAWVMRYPNAVDARDNWLMLPGMVNAAERFAMAFEWCALDPENLPTPENRTAVGGYGYAPTLAQHRVVCSMFKRPLR